METKIGRTGYESCHSERRKYMGGKSGEEKLWEETGKWTGLVVNIYAHNYQTLSIHATIFLPNGALQK